MGMKTEKLQIIEILDKKWQLLLLQIFWLIRQLKIVATVCLYKNVMIGILQL